MRKAFTIMEIMVSIMVLAILASISVPRFGAAVERFRSKEGAYVLYTVLQAQLSADIDVDEGRISSYTLATIDIDIPTMDNFNNLTLDFDGSGSPPTVSINSSNYPVYAHLDRITGAYSLYIQEDGTVLCDTLVICTRMGYAPW